LGEVYRWKTAVGPKSSPAPLQDGARHGHPLSPKMMCQHQQHVMGHVFVF